MTKTDTKKRLRIYIIAAVILVIIAGAAAFVWYRYGSVKVSCMLDDGSVTETRLSRGDSFVFPETADYDGYTFVYWMDAKGAHYCGDSVELYENKSFSPVYTVALETEEHNPYLFPDENGFYRPYDKLTRGEAARMIYALLAQPVEATGNYIDVDKNADYAQATAALWQLKVTGESKFHPDEIITRGELLSLLCSFYRETEQDYAFADADSDSYYYRELCTAAELGWINSGEDVNALPDEELTKIDAVRLINNILNREKAGKVSAKLLGAVPDASPQLSDYAELLEAALGHEYEIVDGVERWTKNDEFTRHSSSFVTIGTHLYYFDRTGTIARNTDVGTMHFDEYGRYTSGMPELDELIQQVIAENTDDSMTQEEKLKVLYDYTVNSFSYLRRNYYAIGETGWQNQEAYTMLSTGMGNCYCYAATFGELARAIGYDAQAYSGTVGSNRAKHSWVEIEIDGVNYTFDSELEMAGRKKYVYRDMYMMTPEQARIWNYKR